jgi:hypothetical protein
VDFFLQGKNCGTCPNEVGWLHGPGRLYCLEKFGL